MKRTILIASALVLAAAGSAVAIGMPVPSSDPTPGFGPDFGTEGGPDSAYEDGGAPAPEPAPNPAGEAPVPAEVPVALLIDMATGQVLYEREADRRFVPASVTKVMTAYTAFKLVEEGRLRLEQVVTITPELEQDWWNEGSTMFLKAGDRVTVSQLMMGITTVSANDASVALAEASVGTLDAWLKLMNANAAELGMRNTHFGTPNGYPDEGRTFTSARDLATLGQALVLRHPELYHRFFGQRSMSYRDIAQANHDPLTGRVDGADGIKTGYTRQAGYNVIGSGERGGRRLMLVLAASPTAALRDRTARALLAWGFDAFQPRQLLPGSARIGEARVQDGAIRRVPVATESPVLVSVREGAPEPRLSIRYRGPVEAPIRAGQRVAWLRVDTGEGVPHDVPLVATEKVARANAWQRLVNGLAGFVS